MINPTVVACPSCDLLADVGCLQHGERAHCSRCGHFLSQHKDDAFSRVQAFAVASLVMLVLANSYPFLSFEVAGLESVMTLPETAWALYRNGMPELALLVAGFIVLLPLLLLLLVLALSIPLSRNQPRPHLRRLGWLVFTLQHWCMVDVFFIGVIVSMVKLAAMATLVLGLSFWAYGAFVICFTLTLSNLDRARCWNAIERLSGERLDTGVSQ